MSDELKPCHRCGSPMNEMKLYVYGEGDTVMGGNELLDTEKYRHAEFGYYVKQSDAAALIAHLTAERDQANKWGAEMQKRLAEWDEQLTAKDAEIERLHSVVSLWEINALKHGWSYLAADNQRMRDVLERICREPHATTHAGMIEAFDRVIQIALAATAQEQGAPPLHPCVACGDYKDRELGGPRGIPHPCEYCGKNIEYQKRNPGRALSSTIPQPAQGGKDE